MKKPIVYIASPYTKGDPAINTHFQCRMFDRMVSDGIVTPYAPLWSHFQHTMFPRSYQFWIDYDNAMIDSYLFDACLRLNAECASVPNYLISESSGADAEVERFKKMGLPVFYDFDELYFWAGERRRSVDIQTKGAT